MTSVTSKVLSHAGKGALPAVSVAKDVVRVDPNPNGRCGSTSHGKSR